MRNLKKVLTLVLTLAMMLSVMVVGTGAAFTDQDAIVNTEAVDMCVALNIIGGYEDGSFQPNGNITRAEMCKMICVALNGGKEPSMGSNLVSTFNDVDANNWAAPYIEYCLSQGIVSGVGGGSFAPNGNITGSQAAKMLLCILGYDAKIQGYVDNTYWETKINVDAAQKGLYDELDNVDASAPLTRDQAAQMIWNALNAYEVEYKTILNTENGVLTSTVVAQDRISDDDTQTKLTLMKDKYNAVTSDPKIMTEYTWNKTKSEYTYTIGDDYTTKEDFTDLYGMKVKVVYATDQKTKTNKVFGIVPSDSSVVATGVLGDVEYDADKAIKIDGTKYRTDDEAKLLQVYPVDQYAEAANLFDGDKKLAHHIEYTFSAIDNDGDDEIDLFVIYPFKVAKVSYVGTTSFNIDANTVMDQDIKTGIKFEDVNAYSDMAKDDYVKIIEGKYNADGYDSYTKISDIVEGKVTSTKSDSVMIDGNWYDYNSAKGALALSSTYKLVMVNGYACANETITTGADVSDYAVVMSAENGAGSVDGHRAKLLFADGKTEIVAAADNYSTWGGELVTFEIEDGEYKLTKAWKYANAEKAEEAGFDEILNQVSGYAYVSGGDSTIDNARIANDAVIFVKYDTSKYKVITGAELAKYNTASVSAVSNAYADKNSSTGFKYVALAYVTFDTDVTIETGNYGYVTSGVGSTKNDKNETVSTLSFWTADGQVNDALADSNLGDKVAKGSVITYEKNSDGSYAIKLADKMTLGSVVSYDESAKRIAMDSGDELKITADTVILNINSESVSGVEGNQIMKAPETASDGVYEKNAYWFSSGGTDLDAIIIDTESNLSYMPGNVTEKPTDAEGVEAALEKAKNVANVNLDASTLGETTNKDVAAGSTVTVTAAPSTHALTLNVKDGATVNVTDTTVDANKLILVAEPDSTVNYNGTTIIGDALTSDDNVTITSNNTDTIKITANAGTITVNSNLTLDNKKTLVLSGSAEIVGANPGITINFNGCTVTASGFYDNDGSYDASNNTGTKSGDITLSSTASTDTYRWGTYYTNTTGGTDTGWVKVAATP